MEKWEEKAIGRKPRFLDMGILENIISGTLNAANGVTNFGIKIGSRIALNKARTITDVTFNNSTIKGKYLKGGSQFVNKIVRKLGTKVIDKAISADRAPTLTFSKARYITPSHKFVANTVFNNSIAFDEKKRVDMLNECGYAPDLKAVVSSLNKEISNPNDWVSDEKWRKVYMPHVLKTTYEEELDKTFKNIQERYSDNKSLLSRGMMRTTMKKAAEHLGNLFEGYSTEIANKTEYLDAPMTIFPIKKLKAPASITEDEKTKWKNITRASLLSSPKELDKKINIAMAPYKVTAERAQEVIEKNTSPTADIKNSGKPYVVGQNAEVDNNKYRSSVATVRDLKRVYEKRSFFGKWLTPSGYKQRAAISQLSEKLTTFGKSKKEIDQHLNLKSEPGKEFDDASLLGYKQTQYVKPIPTSERAATILKDVSLTVAGGAYSALHTAGTATLNAGKYVAQKGLSATNAIIGTASNAISSIGNSFKWAYNSVVGGSNKEVPTQAEPTISAPDLDTKIVDGVEYTEAVEDPEADNTKEQTVVQHANNDVTVTNEKVNEPVTAAPEDVFEDAQSTHEKPAGEEVFEDAQPTHEKPADEEVFEDAQSTHEKPADEEVFEDAQSTHEEIADDEDEFEEAQEFSEDEPVNEHSTSDPQINAPADDHFTLDDEVSATVSQAKTVAAEKNAKSSYTSSIFNTMYNYMPGRANTPAEDFSLKVGEKEQDAVRNMISADTNDNDFYKASAEFLYFKTIKSSVNSDFTQESCDMFSNKFLTDAAIKKGTNIIQTSPAFKKAVVEKHEERQNTNEPFQAEISPKDTASPKLMNMYLSFVSEKTTQAKKDVANVQREQPVVTHKSNPIENNSRGM